MDGHECDAGDGNHDGGEQGDDKPGCAFLAFWRGLGDPHGVDEGVRDEQEEVHISDPGQPHSG